MKPSMLLIHLGLCVLSTGRPHQYHFIGTSLPWFQAQWHCRRHFTDLATVADAQEMKLLVDSVQHSASDSPAMVWIGLYDNLTSWRWSHSQQGIYKEQEGVYRNWGPDQPDNFRGDQLCVTMSSGGKWSDSPCFFRKRFVCYDDTKRADQPFIFVRKFLSWPEAQRYCREHHTDLSGVRNEEENLELQRLLRNRSSWIGLFRTREWSDRSQSSYRNWKFGQPDNHKGQQRCTASDLMDGGLWSDESCHTKLPFICHRDDDERPTRSPLVTTMRRTGAGDPPSTTEEPLPGHMTSAGEKRSAVVSTSTHYRSAKPQSPTTDRGSTVKPSAGAIQPNPVTGFSSEAGPSNSPLTADQRPTTTKQSTTNHLNHPTLSDTKDPTLNQLGAVDQSQHSSLVVRLKVKLTSRSQLSEEEIEDSVGAEIHNLLRAVWKSSSLKIVVRRP